MEKPWIKISIIVGCVVLLIGILLILKFQYDAATKQAQLENSLIEMKELGNNVVRAQAQYVTKDDLEKIAKNSNIDLGPIKDDLEKLNAEVQGLSLALVRTPGYSGTNIPSTSTTPRPDSDNSSVSSAVCPDGTSVTCPDTFGYLANGQFLSLEEPFADGSKIPFGETQFKAWESKPWTLKIYPRDYQITTVLGQDEDGRHYTYHKFQIAANGKVYPVKLTDAKFVEELPGASFRFSPRLYLGIDAGTYVRPTLQAEVAPNLQVSLFSYGKTKVNPEWTFLGVGLAYQSQAKELGFILSPVNYNLGPHLPLVENLHIGPAIIIDTAAGIAVTGGLRVGL